MQRRSGRRRMPLPEGCLEANMAYHFLRVGRESGKTFREYNLDFSVGEGGWNFDDDVRLVQTFLHIIFYEPTSEPFRAVAPPLAGVDDVKVDGICGPITKRYIAYFKGLERKVSGTDLYPDAVMDPFRNNEPQSVGTRSGKLYAFSRLLNAAIKFQDEKGGTNWVDDLIEDERTHPKLSGALVATRKQARQYAK